VSRWAGTRLAVCAFECGEVVVAFGDQPALVQSKRRLIDSELMEQRGQQPSPIAPFSSTKASPMNAFASR
jgi:hypothetical protein